MTVEGSVLSSENVLSVPYRNQTTVIATGMSLVLVEFRIEHISISSSGSTLHTIHYSGSTHNVLYSTTKDGSGIVDLVIIWIPPLIPRYNM